MQAIRRTVASNPVRNFIVPRPSRSRICVSGGDARLASVVTKVLSRQAGWLKTNSNPVLRPCCTRPFFIPKWNKLTMSYALHLDPSCNRWLQSGQLQGEPLQRGNMRGKHMAEETDVIVV